MILHPEDGSPILFGVYLYDDSWEGVTFLPRVCTWICSEQFWRENDALDEQIDVPEELVGWEHSSEGIMESEHTSLEEAKQDLIQQGLKWTQEFQDWVGAGDGT